MDLQDQLRNLFPDHQPEKEEEVSEEKAEFWIQDEPILCKYEKRKGKPITILEGYQGADTDFKTLTKQLKVFLGVGGTYKNETIIIQGDYRDKIMAYLKENGFKTKRVGG
ncbi:translation initiation factor [Muriicola soli]|uniref:Translation initiation factor n=1 Tax=Muriicola soli TaxID=2507538 RepID=A0A411E9B8_9FLAO|nr:translation initiation factor [Muriicola soli]QBA64124.1 translation initiation factor [Muriicola soli]